MTSQSDRGTSEKPFGAGFLESCRPSVLLTPGGGGAYALVPLLFALVGSEDKTHSTWLHRPARLWPRPWHEVNTSRDAQEHVRAAFLYREVQGDCEGSQLS